MDIIPIAVLETNYAYVVHDQHMCLVIDPGSAREVIDIIEAHQLKLIGILLTHKHMDHTAGLSALLAYHDVPVYGGADEIFDFDVVPIRHEEEVTIGSFKITGMHLPGHTMGAVAYLIGQAIFTGDVLFGAGCGRVFEGRPVDMLLSLDRLRQLPDDLSVYFGHEYTASNLRFAVMVEPDNAETAARIDSLEKPSVPSTIQLEKQTNPFLRIDEQTVIDQVVAYVGQEVSDRAERLHHLREWKNQFDREYL